MVNMVLCQTATDAGGSMTWSCYRLVCGESMVCLPGQTFCSTPERSVGAFLTRLARVAIGNAVADGIRDGPLSRARIAVAF